MDQGVQDRTYWIRIMRQIADPVLTALSEQRLKAAMPVESKTDDRVHYTHLEALGRLLSGMAPWLESQPVNEQENNIREHYAELARKAIDAGTDPRDEAETSGLFLQKATHDFDVINYLVGLKPVMVCAMGSKQIFK